MLKVGKDKVCIPYRESALEKAIDYKNLVPQISKEIYSSFSFVYTLKGKKAKKDDTAITHNESGVT